MRAGKGILAPACEQKYAEPPATLPYLTVSTDFAPGGAGGPVVRGGPLETCLVEFTDDPGP